MHRRACYFFKNTNELKLFLADFGPDFLEFTNKYRFCLFIEDEYFLSTSDFLEWFNYDSVISVHEVYSQFLTYDQKTGSNLATPVIESRAIEFWVHDIDTWIHFPPELSHKIKQLGAHVFVYDDLLAMKKWS